MKVSGVSINHYNSPEVTPSDWTTVSIQYARTLTDEEKGQFEKLLGTAVQALLSMVTK